MIDTCDRTGKFSLFRFEAKQLAQHDSFMKLQQIWKRYMNGSNVYQLTRKIEILKKETKSWKKKILQQ